jgi:Raf kinase inhibitor-like YbhB/YbcL family protein
MNVTSSSFENGAPIPGEFAFCVPDPSTHAVFGPNRNPALEWDDVPDGTSSFVLICHDRDVPTKPDDVNQEGREVPADLPRADFYHWVLVDLPGEVRSLEAGAFSSGVTARGKGADPGAHGTRPGVNDYTGWFAGDADMGGTYFGYDGPCPPWNDAIIHHYVFTLYATDLDHCPVEGDFTGPDVLSAIEGHVLAEAAIVGTYTLNPSLAG